MASNRMTPSTDSIDAHGSAEMKVLEGTRVRVEFSFYLPAAATEAELTEWLEFELHANGGMDSKNPLAGNDIEATWVNWKTPR